LFAGDTGIERVVVGTGTDATAITTGTGAAGINASAVLNGLVMVGNSGANALTGTAFADTIDGGLGNDVLTGGAGNDTFLFTTMTTGTRNRDTITDFQAGQDRLQFSKAAYTGIAGGPGTLSAVQFWSGAGVVAAHDADDRFIYNTTTGVLYYDPDGTGTLAASQVAILGTTVHPALNYTDIQVIS
jgi:Ca2+-binding RTX toxin-like protein